MDNYVPTKHTRVTPRELFVALMGSDDIDLRGKRYPCLVLAAHFAFETGSGRFCWCFNLGNVKHTHGDGHDYYAIACTEVLAGVEVRLTPPNPGTFFRAYTSLDDAIGDYLHTLRRQFPGAWRGVQAGDPSLFSHLLKAEHYYTASESLYTKGNVALFHLLDHQIPLEAEPLLGPGEAA